MKSALIGYTGFVGGNINAQNHFDDLYDSTNIAEIEGKSYDLVVSAANRADMWRINQEPEIDKAEIDKFISHIKKVKAKKFVLISTVGVYKKTSGVDEDTKIELDGLPPYGVNRFYLEQFISNNFDSLIVRLPGLFGEGLKKNVIYDLMNNNMVEKIHADGKYQYYNLANIWKDIGIALENNLKLVVFATEPVSSSDVAEKCFGLNIQNQKPEGVNPANWDIRSKHAEIFGGANGYIYSKKCELEEIKKFVESQTAK